MRIDDRLEEEKPEINMTPMVDCVLFLVIFFMITMKIALLEREVRVNPPSAAHAQPVTAIAPELVVNVSPEGRYFVNGFEFALSDLDNLIGRSARENREQAVVIRGDRHTMLQLSVNVLSLCQKHGIRRAYLTTTKPGP